MQEEKLRSRTFRAGQRLKTGRTAQAKVSASFTKEQACFIPLPPGLPPPKRRPARNHEPVLPRGPPPGLVLPRESHFAEKCLSGFQPPPGLPVLPKVPPKAHAEYTLQGFRREATSILRELKLHKNVGLAVSQVRLQGVPRDRQAAEFADLLTMVLEETRGPARRVCMAFIGGLTKAFEVEQCILGLSAFFSDIYEDLSVEVPDLSKRVASELLPTLKSLLEAKDFERIVALQVPRL